MLYLLGHAQSQSVTAANGNPPGATNAKSDGGIDMAFDNTDGRLRGRKLQATRLRIWAQDPHCAMCRKLVAYPHGFELDHKQAVHKDGSNDDDNMQVLCPSCHQSKTAQDCGYKERAKFDEQGRVVW